MKKFFHLLLFTTASFTNALAVVEPGFVPLLDSTHSDGWKHVGSGKMSLNNGVATLSSSLDRGVSWYTKNSYSDFVLKLEFQGAAREFNSGVFVRFPNPHDDSSIPSTVGNEVAIVNPTADQPTGSIYNFKDAKSSSWRPAEWNSMEITVIGSRVIVNLNGTVINDFTGLRQPAGYIGLQSHHIGPVRFRNLRIRDLTSSAPVTVSPVAPPASAPLSTIQTDASQPRIQVIKDQGPNATEWALTPLDEAIPSDIRQNLVFLREDLLDEGLKAPKASTEAYRLASSYCDKVLAALDQRDLARVNAGYRAAQADANKNTSNQALDARRNYKMSWPQYAREESQRAALRENETDQADVKKEHIKVEWANRIVQMRTYLDEVYTQFRAALRK